jgi:hypothetical protein
MDGNWINSTVSSDPEMVELQSEEHWAQVATFLMSAAGASWASERSVRSLRALSITSSAITPLIKALVSWYQDHLAECGEDPAFTDLQKQIDYIRSLTVKGGDEAYQDLTSAVADVKMKATKMIEKNHHKKALILHWWKWLDNILDKDCRMRSAMRPEPVLIVLHGPPGTGKTILAERITAEVIGNTFQSQEEYAIYTAKPERFVFRREQARLIWKALIIALGPSFMMIFFKPESRPRARIQLPQS